MKEQLLKSKNPFPHKRFNPVIDWGSDVLTGVEGYEKLEIISAISTGKFRKRKGYNLIHQQSFDTKQGRKYMVIYCREIGTVTFWQSLKRRIMKWLHIYKRKPITVLESL